MSDLRLQWMPLFFEGDIPDYKGSHFFLQRKRSLKVLVWIRIPGSGTDWKKFQQTEKITLYACVCCVVRKGKDNDHHRVVCCVCCVVRGARTMMIITLLLTWVAWRAQWALMMLTSAASKKKISDQMKISSVPSETGKNHPRIFLVMEMFFMIRKIFLNMRGEEKLKLNRGHIIHCSRRRTPANIRLFFWPR